MLMCHRTAPVLYVGGSYSAQCVDVLPTETNLCGLHGPLQTGHGARAWDGWVRGRDQDAKIHASAIEY